MKNAKDLYLDMVDILDAYHYYTKEEVTENGNLFISAINSKDTEYIKNVIALFDVDIEEEKAIVDNINYLSNELYVEEA